MGTPKKVRNKVMLFHPCEFEFLYIEKWDATKVLGSRFLG